MMSPSVVNFSVKVLLHEGLKEDTVPLNWVKKIRSIKNMERGRGGRRIAALYITMMDAELTFRTYNDLGINKGGQFHCLTVFISG